MNQAETLAITLQTSSWALFALRSERFPKEAERERFSVVLATAIWPKCRLLGSSRSVVTTGLVGYKAWPMAQVAAGRMWISRENYRLTAVAVRCYLPISVKLLRSRRSNGCEMC